MKKKSLSMLLLFIFIIGLSSYSPVMASAMPYKLGAISFYDNNNQKIINLMPNENVTVRVNVTKNDSSAQDGILVVTITGQENKLMTVSETPVNSLSPSTFLTCNMTLPNDIYNCSLNAFIWNGVSQAVPLSEKASISLSEYDGSLPEPTIDPVNTIRVEGIVSDTKYSARYSNLNKDEVRFNINYEYIIKNDQYVKVTPYSPDYNLPFGSDCTLKVTTTNAKQFLQQSCVALIDTETMELVSITPIESKNKILTVNSSNIRYGENRIYDKYRYWDFIYYTDKANNKDDEVTISANATYYYNGSQRDNCRPYDIGLDIANPFTLIKNALTWQAQYQIDGGKLEGSVTLLDNNGDERYDAVFVNENRDFVVDEVFPNSNRISCKIINNSVIAFDFNNTDYDFNFVKDGVSATFEDIKKDDVLSVCGYINSDNELEFGTVYITSQKLNGQITELNPFDETVKINDKCYNYTSWAGNYQVNYLDVGSQENYCLNADGRICAVAERTIVVPGSEHIAYLTKIAANAYDGTVKLRVLINTGEWKTLNFASYVYINNSTSRVAVAYYTNWQNYYSPIKTDAYGTKLIYTMVYYETDNNNQVNKIIFNPDGIAMGNTSSFFGKSFTGNFDYGNNSLGGWLCKDNTSVYIAPLNPITQNGSTFTGASEDFIECVKSNILSQNIVYTGNVYNVTDDDEASAFLITSSVDTAPMPSMTIVDTVSTVRNSNGDDVLRITGFEKGQPISFDFDIYCQVITKIDTSNSLGNEVTGYSSDMRKGTVLICYKNTKNVVNKITILFNASDLKGTTNIQRPTNITPSITLFTKTSNGYTDSFILGYAYSKSSSRYTFAKDQSSQPDANAVCLTTSNPYIYLYDAWYDSRMGKIELSDKSYIETDSNVDGTANGDFIFARVDNMGKISEAVVIKHR